jgi:hypothetical protein
VIEFKREGTKVLVDVQTGIASERSTMRLSWETGSEWFAVLLVDQLRQQLGDAVKKRVEDSYNEGYKNGRAKVAKRQYFSGGL